MERTFIMVKPDGVQRGLIGVIITKLERRGLRLVGMKMLHLSEDFAKKHYAVHVGKPFFAGLIDYITMGPVVAMVWEGTHAIEVARRTMGATNPANADPGTIRADYALEIGRNLVHGSDGPKTAATEIALWFSEDELMTYDRSIDRWIYE